MPYHLFKFTYLVLNVRFENCAVMEFREQKASCEQARQMDMVNYLGV